jgi:hypothetical protein
MGMLSSVLQEGEMESCKYECEPLVTVCVISTSQDDCARWKHVGAVVIIQYSHVFMVALIVIGFFMAVVILLTLW